MTSPVSYVDTKAGVIAREEWEDCMHYYKVLFPGNGKFTLHKIPMPVIEAVEAGNAVTTDKAGNIIRKEVLP